MWFLIYFKLNYKLAFLVRQLSSQPYLKSPTLIGTITIRGPVSGLTVLRDKLFLLHVFTPGVEIYDSVTLALERRLAVKGLVRPVDIEASGRSNCLYIADRSRVVYRVDLVDEMTRKWSTSELPYGLSVAPGELSVIVTFDVARKLKEYTADGFLLREILLPDDVVNPWHAVQLTSGQFVVCHGDRSDQLNRVVVVDALGSVAHTLGEHTGSAACQMDVPLHLAVDRNGFVLFTDVNHKRVQLVTPSLRYVRELVSRREVRRPWHPLSLCLDEGRGLLYVTECEWDGKNYVNGEVLIFEVKERN